MAIKFLKITYPVKGPTMRIAVETMLRYLWDEWVDRAGIEFKDPYSKHCYRDEFVIWCREEIMTSAKSNLILYMAELKKDEANEWKGPAPFE